MREAAESIDDLLVRDRKSGPLCIADTCDQLDRKCLICALLAVLERHVEKQPLPLRQCRTPPLPDRASGQTARDGIGRESTGRATEQGACELIENDDGGQQRAWRRCDAALVCNEALVQRTEAVADLRISLLALREPIRLPQLLEPEMEDLSYPGWLDCAAGRMRDGHDFSAVGSALDPCDRQSIRQAGETHRGGKLLGIGRDL